jgi:hypothetical protein
LAVVAREWWLTMLGDSFDQAVEELAAACVENQRRLSGSR